MGNFCSSCTGKPAGQNQIDVESLLGLGVVSHTDVGQCSMSRVPCPPTPKFRRKIIKRRKSNYTIDSLFDFDKL